MIMREWKARCPTKHRDPFISHLRETGVDDARQLPGFVRADILTRPVGEMTEITLLTFWESFESVAQFAGDDLQVARLYPGDEEFELDPDLSVEHYEVHHD